MRRITKTLPLIVFLLATFYINAGLAQEKKKKIQITKRESARRAMHSRDSLLRSLSKSDTSVNSLIQRIQQYTTSFNQINNNLSDGLDTIEVSQQLPSVIKRLNKLDSLAKTHKSSTLRYLFVLRDNLDKYQDELEGWQSDMGDINTTLIQNENDLIKFSKDSTLKAAPSDSLLKITYFNQLKAIRILWRKTEATNRKSLLRVNLLQDKIALAYTKILDETDQIDSKIKRFALKAVDGDSDYIWYNDPQYDDFQAAFKSTLKLNKILFNYFIKNATVTHFIGLLFFVLFLSWLLYNRTKVLKTNEQPETILGEAAYICKKPLLSSLLVATAIIPYFYSHPPVVFIETFFLVSIILSLIIIKEDVPKSTYNFLLLLFVLTIVYCVSNLFIQISNVDRWVVFLLSLVSIAIGIIFYKKLKKTPDTNLPNSTLALKFFIGMQLISLLLNISGRFSLAKIAGITAVFNLWLLVILYLVVQIIIQVLFLQFQIKRDSNSFINWLDYSLVKKKLRNALVFGASLVWLFFLLQNLNVDDWAVDSASDLLGESRSIGGASFTYGGFVIFILVIWLSSIVSNLISYFYDVSAQRVTDLSIQKRKNRTSALIIRMTVFSLGFLLAVAASGFPLDKLTIIISAFGVGIGFGLQNIVNNLVSGLILAFEKPINIGDVIEVDGHTGTMKEIGIRSSRVLTGNGSEVIIPNGDLISHQVVNWTLSNSNRQIELMIVTAYGVEIEKVKTLIKNLLSNRDDIMTSPAPSVFLNSITESAVEFKVLFWEADINTTAALKSKVLAEIYEALGKEEIKMPSGQKDIYVHFPDGIPLVNPGKATIEQTKKE